MKKTLLMVAAALLSFQAANAQTVKKATSDIVISKVFYAGNSVKGGTKNYAGGEEYIELHNNSAKELDLAGMYIGLVESEASTGAYPVGSITDPAYGVALKQMYQIPTENPVVIAPWGTIVIATAAIDHSADAEGGPDLSKADFEFGGSTNDNPNVPNLNLIYTFNEKTTQVNITNGGDASFLLFPASFSSKFDATNESSIVYANGKSTGSKYLKVNSYYAMDGVEILKTKLTDGAYVIDATRKRLTDSKDKGYVVTDQKMLRDGYVAYRKTALNHNGEIYLYDTDNSCTDWMVSNTIKPAEYNASPDGITAETVVIPESGYLPVNPSKAFFAGKDLHIAWVNVSSSTITFKSVAGDSLVCNNSPFVLVGTPGEHNIYLTDAKRNLASAGANNWIAEGDENYANGVYTVTTKNRYPMKFVNEKGNVRFVADQDGDNNQTMKINVETEGRFYIRLASAPANGEVLQWTGVTPDDVVTDITTVKTTDTQVKAADDAIYNLQGIRVKADQLKKGVYIQNGKKIVF